jgi:thioredoxin-like negative regulator of GroEL
MTITDGSEVQRLCSEGRYSDAVRLIGDLESVGQISSGLLVQKAMCLQLLENGTLEETEEAFQAALAREPNSIEALVEYAWYSLNVKDDAAAADELFQKALRLQNRVNTEILTGLLKCRRELTPSVSPEEALAGIRPCLFEESKITEDLR